MKHLTPAKVVSDGPRHNLQSTRYTEFDEPRPQTVSICKTASNQQLQVASNQLLWVADSGIPISVCVATFW